MNTVYQVDGNGLFLHQTQADGLPYRCVSVTPPTAESGMVQRWDATVADSLPGFGVQGSGSWSNVEDYRTTPLFKTVDGSTYTIGAEVDGQSYPGWGPLPSWLTDKAYPGKYNTWEDGDWVLDTAAQLTDAQTTQIGALNADCAASITAGFDSSALGAENTYPSLSIDQANLQQTAASPEGGLLWIKSAGGAWSLTAHTQAQAQAALADFIAHRNALQEQLSTLVAQVTAASTLAAVQAVTWPE